MKKFFIILIIFISSFSFSFADNQNETKETKTEIKYTEVKTTQPIPWVNCTIIENKVWQYKCLVPKGIYWVVSMIWNIIKWLSFFAVIAWPLAITICWIMYSMWWANEELKNWAKKWLVQIIVWLIVLFSSWYILKFIAPWIYI